jgi:hypothetical protein
MIINLKIYSLDGIFLGESSDLCINSNNPEIASNPIEFWGSTRECVIEQVKEYAKAKFGNGRIRLIK